MVNKIEKFIDCHAKETDRKKGYDIIDMIKLILVVTLEKCEYGVYTVKGKSVCLYS